jgi:hypothetical protein
MYHRTAAFLILFDFKGTFASIVLSGMQDGKTGKIVTAAIMALFFKKHRLFSMDATFFIYNYIFFNK